MHKSRAFRKGCGRAARACGEHRDVFVQLSESELQSGCCVPQLLRSKTSATANNCMPFWLVQVCCMHLFPHLHTLMISQQVKAPQCWCAQQCLAHQKRLLVTYSNAFLQALIDIQGLEGCPNLSRLWLTENEIMVIQGLDHCLQLQHLYLYSNHISCIEGLDNLTNLEVLACLALSTSLAALCLLAFKKVAIFCQHRRIQ